MSAGPSEKKESKSRSSYWGAMIDEPVMAVKSLKRKREDDSLGDDEEMESREETIEEEDEEDEDDEEGMDDDEDEDEASADNSSTAVPTAVKTRSATVKLTTAAAATTRQQQQATQATSSSSSSSATPATAAATPFQEEMESLIRTAYKPEGPKMVFPYRIQQEDESNETEEVPYEYCRTNDIIHHTIRLNQHFRIMSTLLHIAQHTKGTEFRKFPPIPDMIIRKKKLKMYKNFKFTLPVYQYPKPYLDNKTIQAMLQKAVLIVFAQLGVDITSQTVVLVLADVVKDFMRKMCLTCSTYCQWDLVRGHINFKAVMHRTLVDMGFRRGQDDIKEYCESLVKRRNKAFRKTFHLVRLYLKTVFAARQRARVLGAPSAKWSAKHNARSMLPQQGLSLYLPRGMQTITVMERGRRPHIKNYPIFPATAPAPILASTFLASHALKKNEPPPELSAILRPIDAVDQ